MRKSLLISGAILASVISTDITASINNPSLATTNTDAFPGAEGYGRHTVGGRGGKVIYVTNLNNTGAGSLRNAIRESGPRTIVFAVSGTIYLESALDINNDYITIAGQTAPGDGITIAGYPVNVKANEVIIRFLRFRMGDVNGIEGDALGGRNRSNIIIDHCSMSWCTDECSSFYDNDNFTMQWCMLSESLTISVHGKGSHGYGGIWGGRKASFHHNLLAHHASRTPRLCGARFSGRTNEEKVDLRNNVFYNWGPTNGGYAGEGGVYNFVNNFYKPGASSSTKSTNNLPYRIFSPNADDGKNTQAKGIWGTFYVNGNKVDASYSGLSASHKNGITNTNSNNWNGIHPNTGNAALPGGSINGIKSSTEYSHRSVTTHTADMAYEKVLEYVGASLVRDEVDLRIIEETKNCTYTYEGSMGSKNGLIDSQEDVGGWPKLYSSKAPVDTDNDGIPDSWEEANDMDPNDASDANKYELSKNYTNLEVYLNSLVKDIMNGGLADGVASENEDYGNEEDNGPVTPSTYTIYDFDKESEAVTPGINLAVGEHEYNGITIIASSADKVKVNLSTTFNSASDEGTSQGALQTGGSNSGFRVNGMKAGVMLEIWVAPPGSVDAAKLRGIKVTDRNSVV